MASLNRKLFLSAWLFREVGFVRSSDARGVGGEPERWSSLASTGIATFEYQRLFTLVSLPQSKDAGG